MNFKRVLQRLDEPRDAKRAVYRAHRLAGIALFAGSLYTLDTLWFVSEPGAFARTLHDWASGDLSAVLAETLWVFLFLGNCIALVAALIVIFRPSLLKGLERWTDRMYGGKR